MGVEAPLNPKPLAADCELELLEFCGGRLWVFVGLGVLGSGDCPASSVGFRAVVVGRLVLVFVGVLGLKAVRFLPFCVLRLWGVAGVGFGARFVRIGQLVQRFRA